MKCTSKNIVDVYTRITHTKKRTNKKLEYIKQYLTMVLVIHYNVSNITRGLFYEKSI